MSKKASWIVVAVVLAVAAASSPLLRAADSAAPHAYLVAELTVTDPDTYKQYSAAVAPVIAQHGGKYLVRGGQTVSVEGDPPAARTIIIEFESLAAARAFEDSKDYQAIVPLRHKSAKSRVFLAEGVSP